MEEICTSSQIRTTIDHEVQSLSHTRTHTRICIIFVKVPRLDKDPDNSNYYVFKSKTLQMVEWLLGNGDEKE